MRGPAIGLILIGDLFLMLVSMLSTLSGVYTPGAPRAGGAFVSGLHHGCSLTHPCRSAAYAAARLWHMSGLHVVSRGVLCGNHGQRGPPRFTRLGPAVNEECPSSAVDVPCGRPRMLAIGGILHRSWNESRAWTIWFLHRRFALPRHRPRPGYSIYPIPTSLRSGSTCGGAITSAILRA